MKNNKGRSIASVILTILILILIAFLSYEVLYVDIFDIMSSENKLGERTETVGTSSSLTNNLENSLNSPEVIDQNTENSNVVDLNENQAYNSSYHYYYNQLNQYGKVIYRGFETNKENMKSGTYSIDFGTQFSDLINTEGGEDILNEAFQSAWNAYTYDNMDVFYIDVEKLTLTTKSLTALSIHNVLIVKSLLNKSFIKLSIYFILTGYRLFSYFFSFLKVVISNLTLL